MEDANQIDYQLFNASQHFLPNEELTILTVNKKPFTHACIHLQRIYTVIAINYSIDKNMKIEHLTKALDISRESKFR